MPVNSTSGKYATVTALGVALPGLQEWSVSETGDNLDATTADGAGFGDTDTGVDELEITLRGLVKLGSTVLPGIKRGTIFTNLYLYADRTTANPVWAVAQAISLGPVNTVRIRGQIEYSVTVKSKGVYVGPLAS